MLGAIAGDIVGSVYEFNPWQGERGTFPLFSAKSGFTDDTVMSIAVADALVESNANTDSFSQLLIDRFHSYGEAYPTAGYGGRFGSWLRSKDREPYNSFGNGSAMRVSPVGWAFDSLADTQKFAALSASVTHNHPEGIKGAQAVADAIFLARKGASKDEIKKHIVDNYGYNLDRPLAEIRKTCRFDETCQKSVPEAIVAFIESNDFESTIRNAIWLRADADTQAAIAGSIAEAFYGGIPKDIARAALARLDNSLSRRYQAFGKWLAGRNIELPGY